MRCPVAAYFSGATARHAAYCPMDIGASHGSIGAQDANMRVQAPMTSGVAIQISSRIAGLDSCLQRFLLFTALKFRELQALYHGIRLLSQFLSNGWITVSFAPSIAELDRHKYPIGLWMAARDTLAGSNKNPVWKLWVGPLLLLIPEADAVSLRRFGSFHVGDKGVRRR